MNTSAPSPRLTLLPADPCGTGKRPAIRRYKLGRVVSSVDVGAHMDPAAPATAGVRAP